MFSASEPKVPVTSTKGFGRKEQLVAARMPDKVAETFKTNVEKATSKASLTSSPSKKCLPFISSTGKKTSLIYYSVKFFHC